MLLAVSGTPPVITRGFIRCGTNYNTLGTRKSREASRLKRRGDALEKGLLAIMRLFSLESAAEYEDGVSGLNAPQVPAPVELS